MLFLNQGVSDMRQKRLLVDSDCLTIVVISRHLLVAFLKARHERIQLIFDFYPVPIAHRLRPQIQCRKAVYLKSAGDPFDIKFVVKNGIPVDQLTPAGAPSNSLR